MKKNNKKLVATIIAIAITLIATLPVSAAVTYDRQSYLKEKANELANIYREIGFSESSAAVRLNQLIWAQANGQITSGTYLYDSTTNQKFWLGSPDYIIEYGQGNYGSDYNDGTYNWFYDDYRQQYYRFDRNGDKVWKQQQSTRSTNNVVYNISSGTTTYNVDTSSAYTTGSSNSQNYNYTYKNVRLYSGRIYGLRGFDSGEVEKFAKLISSYTDGQDLLHKSAFAWSVLDLKGNNSMDTVISRYYGYYNYDAWVDDDLREFAREIMFRKQAERSMTYVGRTLPSGYSWVVSDGYGNLYFRKSENGENYTFPNAYTSSGRSQYHSPY